MNRPTQKVFIVEGNTAYAFDAVMKLETQTTLKIAETASDLSGKKNVVNFAFKQPVKINMEVCVSDTVETVGEPLTAGSGSRSINAYNCLWEIQKRRNYLTVITPNGSYPKMMIESIAEELSDEYQSEMHASVSFKEMIVQPAKEIQNEKAQQTDTESGWSIAKIIKNIEKGAKEVVIE